MSVTARAPRTRAPRVRAASVPTPAPDLEVPTEAVASIDLPTLLAEASARGIALAGLTPEVVLGLSREEVARLRQARAETMVVSAAPALPPALTTAWRRSVSSFISAPNVHYLRQSGPRQVAVLRRVVNAIDGAARSRGVNLVFEEMREGSAAVPSAPVVPSTEIAAAGLFHLRTAPVSHFTSSVRIGRRTLAADASADAGAPTGTGSRIVRIGTVIVAAVDADNLGARLFVDPFLEANGRLTSATAPARLGSFMSILDAIMVAAEISPVASAGTSSANPEDARERELREAVATLDLLPGFVSALGTRPDQQRANLVREVQQKTNEVTSLRQQLMTAVREKANLDLSLEALDRAAGSLSNEVVTNALVQITRIRTRLPAVREITLASSRGNPRINVSLHPMVLAGEDGQHYLCDRLHFAFPLDGGSVPEWATVTRSRQSPHPHVNSGGSTCWGQAETPLRQALERRDFVTVVTLIVGWASIYNRNSPYVHLRGNCGFPAVNLAPGWHPEIPVRPV